MHEQRSPRGDSVYRQIVDNARIATGAVLVLLTRLDPDNSEIQVPFWSGLDSDLIKGITHRERDQVAGTQPLWLPMRTPDEPCCRIASVYTTGTPLLARIEDATEGCPHGNLLRSAGAVAGIKHVFICPFRVWGRVEGALSFFTRQKPRERKIRLCETFVRQAALTLENAVLCDVLQVQLDHVERSRRQLAEADERLRREISELLGSRVQSRLMVIWHRLGECQRLLTTDSPKAMVLLEEIRKLVDELRERDIRDASYQLHPSIVHMGLLPALRSVAATYEENFQVDILVSAQLQQLDDPLDSPIPEELRLTAYRVLDEALKNVRRHASATRVTLSLGIDHKSRLEMVIRDNGCGFDTNLIKPGLGLSILGCRVDQASGTWRITSESGQGTVLSIIFPLDGRANAGNSNTSA